jgi:hypothetical protein
LSRLCTPTRSVISNLIELAHGSAAVVRPAVPDGHAQQVRLVDVRRKRVGPVDGKSSDRETWGPTNDGSANGGTEPQIAGVAGCGLNATADGDAPGPRRRGAHGHRGRTVRAARSFHVDHNGAGIPRCQHRRGSGRASIHLASQRHSGAGLRPEGPAASHGSGGAVRCPFGRVVRTRRAQVARLGRCSSALLHHVRKLVGDQLSTLARIRGDVFAPDDDISSRRVGHCAHALGGMCSPRPGVYSHLAEVVTEAGFHERSDTCVERLARRGYYLLNDGRRSSLSSVLCVAARLLQARDRMYLVAARRYCAWSCEVTRLFPRRSLVFLCVCMHLFSTLVHASRPKR